MTSIVVIASVGLAVGFLGGVFGKGGSAVATPLLHAAGVPAAVAVASPLPATLPSTVAASWAYRGERLVDPRVVRWSVAVGLPATVAGAVASRWVDAGALVHVTDVVVVGIGLRSLLARHGSATPGTAPAPPGPVRLVGVAAAVGGAAGLLANSGGFLLAPLYMAVLHLPVKRAFASSLVVAATLAMPGTLVHAALGHVDWSIVATMAVTSVPAAFAGARVALRTDAARLERSYGMALVLLGVTLLLR